MKTIDVVKRLNNETAAEVFYTGIFVRDTLKKQKPLTLDFVVRGLTQSEILSYLKKYGKIRVSDSGTIYFKSKKDKTEAHLRVVFKRGEQDPSSTIKADARHQDFTINALYAPVNKPLTKKFIVDHVGGLLDLKARRIRAITDPRKLIKQDSNVIARAISIAAKFNYKIDGNLFYAIKAAVPTIEITEEDMDSYRDMLVEIVMSKRPSKYLRMLHSLGILRSILPELDICYGVTQNEKYHKHDVFTHCVLACDNAEEDLIVRLSALLHDCGKPQTREEIGNGDNPKITFYSHEVVGAKLVKHALRRLGFEKSVVKRVSDLVYLHMYNYEPEKWTDTAVRRFIAKADITMDGLDELSDHPLFLIRRAERMSYGHEVHAVSHRQKMFEERIREVVVSDAKSNKEKDIPISGHDIMTAFKLEPGPYIGKILNHLARYVDINGESTHEELMEIAADFVLTGS